MQNNGDLERVETMVLKEESWRRRKRKVSFEWALTEFVKPKTFGYFKFNVDKERCDVSVSSSLIGLNF